MHFINAIHPLFFVAYAKLRRHRRKIESYDKILKGDQINLPQNT